MFSKQSFEIFYDWLMAILAGVSVLTVVLALFFHTFSLINPAVLLFLNILLVIFVIDYAARLTLSVNKRAFLLNNAFDLLSLIPFHPVFAIFRIARIVRIVRKHHLLWRFGLDGKMSRNLHRFIYNTGFVNLFSVSVLILVLSALFYSSVEKISLTSSLWWAITTATTVGYGDISPKTTVGRFIAAFLMIGGVGFIGLLTSTITDFFTSSTIDSSDDQISELSHQIALLTKKIDRLERKIDKNNKPKRSKKPKK